MSYRLPGVLGHTPGCERGKEIPADDRSLSFEKKVSGQTAQHSHDWRVCHQQTVQDAAF